MERIRVKNNGRSAGAAYGLIPFVLGLVLGLALAGLFLGWRSGRDGSSSGNELERLIGISERLGGH
ncbi:hypothetical protein AGMMS50268_39630 [Spirochaetia bacterium]|nr:hypothetical protein AGMMS50268_39630 [Spirochaetia bacterium]